MNPAPIVVFLVVLVLLLGALLIVTTPRACLASCSRTMVSKVLPGTFHLRPTYRNKPWRLPLANVDKLSVHWFSRFQHYWEDLFLQDTLGLRVANHGLETAHGLAGDPRPKVHVLITNDLHKDHDPTAFIRDKQVDVVFHLSDEQGHRNPVCVSAWSRWYPLVKTIFRQYDHPEFRDTWRSMSHVHILHLFWTGDYQEPLTVDVESDRVLHWSFVGNIHNGSRREMASEFQSWAPGAIPAPPVSKNDMQLLYANSSFVPSPLGNCVQTCFRLLEAAFMGAIPMVVGSPEDLTGGEGLGGPIPPFVFGNSWANCREQAEKLLQEPNLLHQRRKAVRRYAVEALALLRARVTEAFRYLV